MEEVSLDDWESADTEVAQALFGFLDPPIDSNSLLDISTATPFQNQNHISTLLSPSSSNGLDQFNSLSILPSPKRHRTSSCSHHLPYIHDQPPPLFQPDPTPATNNCLSAQSVAARQRRRRITDKTQELSHLIPGGNRMNTAEMLHAAYKYVKFLESQLAILDLMASTPESENVKGREYLQLLLASSAVQESLLAQKMCIVPKEIMDQFID